MCNVNQISCLADWLTPIFVYCLLFLVSVTMYTPEKMTAVQFSPLIDWVVGGRGGDTMDT